MHCIDFLFLSRTYWRRGTGAVRSALAGTFLVSACSTPTSSPVLLSATRAAEQPTATAPPATVRLPPPAAVRSMADVRLQAARRLIAANPEGTYTGPAPDPLLAIPVLEIELRADGHIRRIDVLRMPQQAQDTVQIAVAAVHRAAPFGDLSRVPKPWRFTETFLFDDDRKFKPRVLD